MLEYIIAATSLLSALTAFGAMLISLINRKKIQEVHLSINSRMTQLLELTQESAHAAGMKEEQDANVRPQ
jgi:hypothetical protein